METERKNNDSTADIYEILGISPATVQEDNDYPNKKISTCDINLPEGDVTGFDVLWKHFRLCMILGIIATALPFAVWFASILDIHSLFSYNKDNDLVEDVIEQPFAVEEIIEEPDIYDYSPEDNYEEVYHVASNRYFFEGTINNKYPIHLFLDINDGGGKYYYDKSGVVNCMYLKITQMEYTRGLSSIEMNEYNSNGDLCGKWTGILTSDGELTGYGEFLGKTMPFNLTTCLPSDTDF